MLEDTITAVATPLGEGALSIVRISGPSALGIADACFRGKKRPSEMRSHTTAYGRIVDGGEEVIDRVVLSIMRGPHTSTGEDTVEISCHGGRLPSMEVLGCVLSAGARLAEPGEFTRRAVLNGRMDLVQAEGVLEVIRARTPEGLRAAVRQVGGDVSREFRRVQKRLDECRTHVECAIEFAEETAPWSDEDIRLHVAGIRRDVEDLLTRSRAGRRIQEGVGIAIAGKPNVGKSTLFNRLLQEDRAIVSAEPGTTRDVVAEWTSFGRVPVRLMDMAGIHTRACGVEDIAVRRARASQADAEVVLLVLDASRPLDREDQTLLNDCDPSRTMIVLNKMDIGPCDGVIPAVRALRENIPCIQISALFRDGVDELKHQIAHILEKDVLPKTSLPASMRQIDILGRTCAALDQSLAAIESGAGIELTAHDLREASDTLGELCGTTAPEEILNEVFSRFCIGK